MKKKKLAFLLILFSVFLYGQKKYVFNYSLEYTYQLNDTSEIKKVYILTNSQDNSYYIRMEDIQDGYLNCWFKDVNGFHSWFSIKKDNAFDSLPIKLTFELVKKQDFLRGNNLKRYSFQTNLDTIISGKKYKFNTLRYKKNRESRTYNKGTAYYVVEENTDFHLPLLLFSSSFDVTLINRDIPNGIPKILFTTSLKQDEKKHIYKLVNFTKIDKQLTIPKECLD